MTHKDETLKARVEAQTIMRFRKMLSRLGIHGYYNEMQKEFGEDALDSALGVAETGWTPTAENVNALPKSIRQYIHDIEARCDPAGDIRELTIARDTIRQLEAALELAAQKGAT